MGCNCKKQRISIRKQDTATKKPADKKPRFRRLDMIKAMWKASGENS